MKFYESEKPAPTNFMYTHLDMDMYNDPNRTFSEVLESRDPSQQYEGTPLANLDAFERQLYGYGIQVNPKDRSNQIKHLFSDFFSSPERSVLFYEYIRRSAVRKTPPDLRSSMLAMRILGELTVEEFNTIAEFFGSILMIQMKGVHDEDSDNAEENTEDKDI